MSRHYSRAFTVVELIVVIVVIATLTTIVVVGYSAVRGNANRSATLSELGNQIEKIKLYSADHQEYPESLMAASLPEKSNGVSFSYTRDSATGNFCLTALFENKFSYSKGEDGSPAEKPCDGHSGGTSYCPSDTHVPINGFFCDGAVGSVATLNNSAIKLDASTAPVPDGAPGAFVGRQTSRDNNAGPTFDITPADTYCIEGWVSTVDSTVTHSIGLVYNNGTTNSWVGFGTATPQAATGKWVKVGGCRPVPAGYINARFWSQNNGTNGTTATPAWYHTAIRFWKQ